jgi:hypothetical protein
MTTATFHLVPSGGKVWTCVCVQVKYTWDQNSGVAQHSATLSTCAQTSPPPHQELSLTSWGCADKEKWSDDLHRSIKNCNLQAEDVQTRRNDQMIFTEASRTITYILRMCRQGEMIRWSSQKHQELSLTCWGCADKEKWSDDLHRSIKNYHLHPEDVQTRRNDQMIFTEASRTITYILRMCRQEEMIRWSSQKHQEQSLTY